MDGALMAAVNAGGGQGPAAALAAAGAACQCLTSHGGEEGLSPAVRMWFMAISVFLVLFAGLMAGLTLGLLSLDRVDLEVIRRSGTEHEVWLVERVEPVLARPHFLLATLLLCNSVAMEALPLFLDRLLNPVAAILLSVTAILIAGEIAPQAVCKRYGLQVGAYMAWFVRFLMLLTAPITWPIGRLLDRVLGEESALFKRRELKALMSIHAEPEEESEQATLTLDEVQVIQGALDMASKHASDAMTPMDKVFLLSSDAEVNDELLLAILQRGHSRLPVYEGDDKQNIVGLILVKELLLVDEDAGVRIRDLRLRDMPFMSADTLLYDVLKVFRYGRSHMSALTRPGAGGRAEIVGVITIEDVLEELLQQEIVDETDQYVDNLQTIKTASLQQSLQQLPANLRQLLTRSMVQPAPSAAHLPRVVTTASMAAAAAGAVAGASVHGTANLPHSPGAVAAAAATTALLASRRTTSAGTHPAKAPQLMAASLAGGPDNGISADGIAAAAAAAPPADTTAVAAAAAEAEAKPSAGAGGSHPAGSASELSWLLARNKPPVPRRTSSSRSLRGRPGDLHRQGSDALRQPLLEGEHEGSGSDSPWASVANDAAAPPGKAAAQVERSASAQQQLRELSERRRQQIERMLDPPPQAQQQWQAQQPAAAAVAPAEPDLEAGAGQQTSAGGR